MLLFIFYTFIGIVSIQIFYYLVLFARFSFSKPQQTYTNNFPVSVIICAKNEAKNLANHLESILQQNYLNFEVIVVNDASSDHSLEILNAFQNNFKQLQIINLPPTDLYTGNKKNAITKGIEKAKHEHLLFTDADCKPISENWIQEMTSHFTSEKQIVLGYGAYQKKESSFLNKLIRYETVLTAIQYFSYAKIGLPYMGVGRNLAYTKSIFKEANGLQNHMHIKSGDDDLLINQIATSKNTSYCTSPDSFTISKVNSSFVSWLQQKRRHVTTANYYKPIFKFSLGLFYLSQFLFWMLAIILLTFSFYFKYVIIILSIRLITQYISIGKSAKIFNEKDLVLRLPIFDFLMVCIQFGISIRNLVSKPKTW